MNRIGNAGMAKRQKRSQYIHDSQKFIIVPDALELSSAVSTQRERYDPSKHQQCYGPRSGDAAQLAMATAADFRQSDGRVPACSDGVRRLRLAREHH